MNEENKTYQLVCLFSPHLSHEELGKLVQEIKKEITDQEGLLVGKEVSAANLIKKKLAYLINKHQEAFFLSADFVFPIQSINQLKKQIASKKNIIRCLITVKEKEEPQTKKAEEFFDLGMVDKIEPISKQEDVLWEKTAAKEKVEEPEFKKTMPEKNVPIKKAIKEKVKIEELDKKLEEILNQ